MASAKPDAGPLEPGGAAHSDPAPWALVWRRSVRPVLPALLAVYVPLLLVLALTRWVLVAHAEDVVEPLRLDVGALLGHSVFSMLHVVGWAIALVAGFLGARRAAREGRAPRARLLVGAAALSALFLLDDTFQLHKPVVPDWSGLPPSAVLASYACLLIVWAWVCRHEIARTEVTILVVTLAFFATWYGCKVASPFAARTSIEISAKLCGVAGWALYVVRTSAR
jgi:hypothetical protein